MTEINNRIKHLRDLMAQKEIDFYLIPTEDFHQSEFVGEYFKTREYMSGFTGSAGTLVISKSKAGLWTDGRYFLQADHELSNTEIELYRMGEKGVPTIFQYILENIDDGMSLGFDGRCICASTILEYKKGFERFGKKILIQCDLDLVNEIWIDRPVLPESEAYVLEKIYCGESFQSKLQKIILKMKKRRTDLFILSSLDDIAWFLNIRGNDVQFNPVLLSYLLVYKEKVILYCREEALVKIKDYILENNIIVKPYNQIYKDLQNASFLEDTEVINQNNDEITKTPNDNVRVLADLDKINYLIYKSIITNEYCIVDDINPTTRLKAIKNKVEIENERRAHIKDAVAFVKFLYWFHNMLGKQKLTELDVAEYLYHMRKEQQGFLEESFESIVAYGKNGAVIHYSPNLDSNTEIKEDSFLLMDTGGHYLEGTTDITRTIACGNITKQQKRDYTLVLKGNLALGDAKFKYGVSGTNLDILARMSLWNEGLDYNHGTGHGVGYLLNVHEGPNNIRWKPGRGKNRSCVIEEGMITSNEPGLYLQNEYGIRLENMIVCKQIIENSFGTFMGFETLTMVPFDLNAIDVSLLNSHEIDLINLYHQTIYQKLSPFLNGDERSYLQKITQQI